MKFIKVAINADKEKRKEISEKIYKKEVKLSHFTIDGDNSYHYYQILIYK